MGRSWPMLIDACVLFRVTIVGLETIFDFCTCCSALSTRLKSLAENTADRVRAVVSAFVSELRRLNALLMPLEEVSVVPLTSVVLLSEESVPVLPVLEVDVGTPL